MAQELALMERIQLAIRIGESHFREFKSAFEGPPAAKVPRPLKDLMTDVGRTLVGFANADGGELLIGVEDDGSVSGVQVDESQLQLLLRAPTTHVHADTPLPKPRGAVATIDGKTVVYFSVAKGTQYIHLTSDGRCLRRVDRDTLPLSAETITATRLEDGSRKYDREFAEAATLDDLDVDLVRAIGAQIAYGISPEKCLQHLDLAEFTPEGLRLTKAAVLLFAKDIRKWHGGCFVRIVIIKGKERGSGSGFNVIKDTFVSDNILRLIDRAWEALTTMLAQQTRFTVSARFQQELLYPQVACREALINAIAHRNYAIEGRGTEITLFDDRMEVFSPGQLLSTVSLSDIRALKGAHESRNPMLARVLREAGLVQEMGEGMRRIFSVMRSNALAEPALDSNASGFTVTLFNRSLYDPAVKLWLTNYDRFELSENLRAVVSLGYGAKEFSTQDIIDRLGIVDTDKVRELVTTLKNLGILITTKDKQQVERFKDQHRLPRRNVPKYAIQNASTATPTKDTISTGLDEESKVGTIELYLGNLPANFGISDITTFLSGKCDVIDVRIPNSANSTPGFAFATVSSQTTIKDLIADLDGRPAQGRRIHVREARPRRRPSQ